MLPELAGFQQCAAHVIRRCRAVTKARPGSLQSWAAAFGITHNRHRDWHNGNHPGWALGCWLRGYADQVWLLTREPEDILFWAGLTRPQRER